MVRRTRWVTALVTVGLSATAGGLMAQQPPPRLAKNVLFAEVSFLIIVGNASLNYERRLSDQLSARVGVGAGYLCCIPGGLGGGGAVGMFIFTTTKSASKFEAGLGLSYVTIGFNDATPHVFPAITLGYRHQRPGGGFVFRAGANWTYVYGLPFQVSFGHAF